MDVDLSMSSAPAFRRGWYPVTFSASLHVDNHTADITIYYDYYPYYCIVNFI